MVPTAAGACIAQSFFALTRKSALKEFAPRIFFLKEMSAQIDIDAKIQLEEHALNQST